MYLNNMKSLFQIGENMVVGDIVIEKQPFHPPQEQKYGHPLYILVIMFSENDKSSPYLIHMQVIYLR